MSLSYYLLFLLHFVLPNDDPSFSIYIAKIEWHVGIIINIENSAVQNIDALKEFENYRRVDIGWGDAEFYQGPADFDLFLASKAILFPTPSVVRIKGYNRSIEQIAEWRDYFFEIKLSFDQYKKLCEYIDESFERDSKSNLLQTSEKYQGDVKFYSSTHKYHLLNTCNTWVAEALKYSGLEIDPGNVITADHLFEELLNVGILIKYKEES